MSALTWARPRTVTDWTESRTPRAATQAAAWSEQTELGADATLDALADNVTAGGAYATEAEYKPNNWSEEGLATKVN